ncbi:MAG: tRNA adenosine(34) deaminase TadA [Gammaproteobacteria bacterium]|nr:MAG: tRNA adenosine(34) deaminase TadA [Gammaproteobacteria bacterium]
MNSDSDYMQHALHLASTAAEHGEVPVGCVIVRNDEIIGEGYNQPISSHDPSAHAEIIAMRNAGKQINNYRLCDATLYVTLEPCVMCVGAMVHARVKRLVFAAMDPRTGAAGSVYQLTHDTPLNHQLDVTSGVMAEQCGELLTEFFRERR